MKKVIVVKGPEMVFKTLEDASKALGRSVSALSRDSSIRLVDRVFVGQYKNGKWTGPIVMNVRNSGYFPIGDELRVIKKSELVSVKDITESWYFGTEFESKARLW